MGAEHHIVVDISGHGYGHAGMTIPILDALHLCVPKLKVTIRTTVPAPWLAERINSPFDVTWQCDSGMAMAGPMQVLVHESLGIYKRIHTDWAKKIDLATEQLAQLRPTLLLSNISYVSVAAARNIRIPAIAFGPINWADIFRHYCIDLPGAKKIWMQMVESYSLADIFLQTVPFMPMPSIRNGRAVGPIARIGRDQRLRLRRSLGLGQEVVLVLIAFGGIPTKDLFEKWPRLNSMRVLVGSGQDISHADAMSASALGVPFIDLVRSCDVLITKPGYGLVTEAACNGTPVLLLPRDDWPETAGLKDWLSRHGRMRMLTNERLRDGDFLADVRKVLALPAPLAPAPSGVAEVTELVAAYLA